MSQRGIPPGNRKEQLRRAAMSASIYERNVVMKCPNCGHTDSIEVDLHSDGFCKELYECNYCESIWYTSLVHTKEEHTKFSSFEDEYVAEDEKVWFS